MPGRGGVVPLLLLLGACKAATTSFDYPEDLTHPNYVQRSKAVQRFAELRDREQLPRAFALLLDEEAHIRLVADRTLREMMPDAPDFGYRAYLPEADRIRTAAAWEAWWRTRAEVTGG
jgi:hypothetical protein